MTWIMIITYMQIVMGSGGSPAITSAEFSSYEACAQAGKDAEKSLNTFGTKVRFVCVKKGDKHAD